MSEKKKELTPEEISAAMDAQVLAAQEDPSLVVDGDPNDGGHVVVEGHGWTDEQLEERAANEEAGVQPSDEDEEDDAKKPAAKKPAAKPASDKTQKAYEDKAAADAKAREAYEEKAGAKVKATPMETGTATAAKKS
jgi:hypothetical protein